MPFSVASVTNPIICKKKTTSNMNSKFMLSTSFVSGSVLLLSRDVTLVVFNFSVDVVFSIQKLPRQGCYKSHNLDPMKIELLKADLDCLYSVRYSCPKCHSFAQNSHAQYNVLY